MREQVVKDSPAVLVDLAGVDGEGHLVMLGAHANLKRAYPKPILPSYLVRPGYRAPEGELEV